jgi:outer membrane lipoprotein-sorting protein
MRIFKFLFMTLLPIFSYTFAHAVNEHVLEEVEAHLNNIQTLQAGFQQHTPHEGYSSGLFYYKQPRKFLWQYNLPHNQKVVSTGSRIFFHDPDTDQTSQLPPNTGFANFLNQKPMTLKSDDFDIKNIQVNDNVIKISVGLNKPENTFFNLNFSRSPIKLLSMTQKGDFGTGISIVFSSLRLNQEIADDVFKFTPELEQTPE